MRGPFPRSHNSATFIPIEESLLYVRPLYLRAQQGRIPELTRVIVAYQREFSLLVGMTESDTVDEPRRDRRVRRPEARAVRALGSRPCDRRLQPGHDDVAACRPAPREAASITPR